MGTTKDLRASRLRHIGGQSPVDWQLDAHQFEVLRQACLCLDRIAAAEQDIQAVGALVQDRFDQLKPHPGIAVVRDYRGLFGRLVLQLGLTATGGR